MSLRSTRTSVVPDQTARLATAAVAKGTLCLQRYAHLGTICEAQDGTARFPRRGQPAAAPCRLALVTMWQCVAGLSEGAAAPAVRGRMDWKSLLWLALDDPGFDSAVLGELRQRLLRGGAEQRL